MALQKAVEASETPMGVALPDAYHKLSQINVRFDNSVEFFVTIYASQATRQADKAPVITKRYLLETFDFVDDHGFKKLLYAYLKTLAEYTDATDV